MVIKLLLWTWQNSQSWSDTPVRRTFIRCTMSHSAHLFHISITIFQHNPQTFWRHICPIPTHSTIIRKCKWLSVNGCKYKSPTFCRFTSCHVTDELKWKDSCSGGTKTVISVMPVPCNLSYKTCIKNQLIKNGRQTQLRYPDHLQTTISEHRKSSVFDKHFVN